MILIAFALTAVICLGLIALARTHRQMNAVCIAQALVFALIAVYVLLAFSLPVNQFLIGNQQFFIDHLGLFEVFIATSLFFLAAIYAGGYVESLLEAGELERSSLRLFYTAFSLILSVLIFAFFADNLALFWILAEITTVLSALLIAILSARENIDAAIKYIFVTSVAMLFAFLGLIFLFEISRSVAGTGSLNWTVLMELAPGLPAGAMVAVFALVFLGFSAKSGVFPFHTWLPEAHAKAPSAVSAILSGVLLNVGIYGILRVFAIVHQTDAAGIAILFVAVFGIATLAISAFSMLRQENMKKLIAFSSIENMGLLLIGISVASPLAIFFVLLHTLAHSLTKASLFFSAGVLHRQYKDPLSHTGNDDIHDVFRYQPLAAWGMILGGLAIIGVPFTPVFLSKIGILLGVGQVSAGELAIVLVLLFIAAAALGWFIIRTFSRVTEGEPDGSFRAYAVPVVMKIPIVALLLAIVILGVAFPDALANFLNEIVRELKF